jgi:O-antigen ligase
VGWGNYRARALELVKAGQRNKSIADYSHPHNQYLSALASGGVVGVLFLLGLFIVPFILFYNAYKNESEPIRALAISGMVLVIAFSHFALTEGVFERNITMNFYAFYSALIMSLIMRHKSHAATASRF